MKKIALMLALVVIGYTAGAQSLNVSSAREAQNRGYFDKAKKLIDAACEHEQTRNDAKTWYYAGLIYSQIGGEAEKPKSKYKNLDPDWLIKCKSAALRCKELDTEKEYAEGNNTILSFVGNEYYKKAITAFNQQNWTEAMSLCDESIKIFNECGKKEYASESYLLAGKAAFNAQNNEAILQYLKPLVRTRSKDAFVYRTLFDIYKSTSDTNEAIKVAQNYAKAAKDDYNANMIVHASLLAAAGAVFEGVNDFANAETRYKESLTALPNQFLANFGLGKMLYNRAVDKLNDANNVPPDDETGLYEKLDQESKDFFRQSIPYFTNAISFIDNLDEHGQATNRANLFHCLNALNTVYARLEMYDELKPIKARIDELKKEASN